MRKFNPYPVTNYGRKDERYEISLEYCGYEHPMFTARFCDKLIGRSRFYSSAVMLAVGHNAERKGAMIIECKPA